MVDTCVFTTPGTGPAVWDEATGQFTYPAAAVVYDGPCKVQTGGRVTSDPETGERVWTVDVVGVHLPVLGSQDVPVRATGTVTSATYDPALVGRVFTVTGPHVGSMKTARRLPCEGVT